MFSSLLRNGTVIAVAALIITVLGLIAALRIPVQMIPDLDVRTISVRTSWPGATPQDVEKEIVVEQEEYLRNLPNLQRLEATASSGQAQIELDFPFGVDMTDTLIRVNNALNQVPSYPVTVKEPRIFATSFSGNAFMFFRVTPLPGNPRNLDMDMMKDYLEDNVRPRMSSVPGVSEVMLRGGAERQVRILVDPVRLADRQLSISDVRSAIRNRNEDTSGGEIESGKRRYLLRTVGRFDNVDQFKDVIIARRNDALIRLSDVATVELDHFEVRNLAFLNGEPMINMFVRRESGSNVIDIKRQMLVEVEAINADFLNTEGMSIALIADDAGYVEASVRNVWVNLALGAILATLLMYLFLRSLRLTAVAVVGIPVCTIAAFIGLLITGRTINVISLAGVAFAIGMTLDNSIVALESIALEYRRGLSRLEAAVAGIRSVWTAILASTLTTVLVFAPVIFIQEEAGQLYSDVAIAISASILTSMLIAITLLPAACANLQLDLRTGGTESGKERQLTQRLLSWTDRLIATSRARIATIVVVGGVSLAAIYFFMPPAEYLPEGEEPKAFARLNAPPGYNLATMTAISLEIQQELLPFVGADPDDFHRGRSAVPAVKYINMGVDPDGMRIIAETVDAGDIDALLTSLEAIYSRYPGMRSFVSRGSIITSNDGGTRSINLDISGPGLATIYDAAQAAYDRSKVVFGNPRIQTSPKSLSLAQPLLEVRPKWERIEELGITAGSLGETVAALTDGAFVDEFFLDDDKIDIYLYGLDGGNSDIDDLADLPVYTPAGTILPLGSIATINETVDTSTIRRVNGMRTVTLNIIPPEDIALESGVQIVRDEVLQYLRDTGAIPADVSIAVSGASDQLDATREALLSNYSVALVIIYLLLVAILGHWGYPLLIMVTIPLGIGGGITGLALLNGIGSMLPSFGLNEIRQPFDMISMLGFLILLGTVVNNPILIVDRAVANVRQLGMDALAAVQEAVRVRLRPIAMSTLTTIVGLLPLVLLPGAGTELYRGVGAIVMFGILNAAIVTVTLLPALTVVVLKWQEK